MSIETALGRLGVADGVLAVTGGTETFDLFLPLYDRFLLTQAQGLRIPRGTPCFSKGSPQDVLREAGLIPQKSTTIDSSAGIVQMLWLRSPSSHSPEP
jgi:hypothetical protein